MTTTVNVKGFPSSHEFIIHINTDNYIKFCFTSFSREMELSKENSIVMLQSHENTISLIELESL